MDRAVVPKVARGGEANLKAVSSMLFVELNLERHVYSVSI